jgi:hypothetical protein
MTRARIGAISVVALTAWLESTASAHVFAEPYTLPVTFWMYLYGCAATLVVSFAIVGYFAGTTTTRPTYRSWDVLPASPMWQTIWKWKLRVLRAGAVASLLLTIAAGLAGTADPAANINMTLFWIAFMLAFTYLTAIVGDVFALINPWRAIVEAGEGLGLDLSRSRLGYPARLGYLPAFAFYVALIWIELFPLPRPSTLSIALIVYTAATFAGVFLFGKNAWFKYGELFSVFFRVVGTMAPVEYAAAAAGRPARIRLRPPFLAALYHPADHPSLLLFVLFMLSSTTYDAIHETNFWVSLYWRHLVPLTRPLWGSDVILSQVPLTNGYFLYQRLGLVLSPFFYLLFYLLVLACARLATKTSVPLRTLAMQFALTLVPIALAYHATHYYTLLLTKLPSLVVLASDPFGLGWRLFVTTFSADRQTPLNMGIIWHTQVLLMVGGHVVAVYLAHMMAVRVFPSHRQGIVSQVPMLVLMVAYTCLGLWVLSLPLSTPQMLPLG